MSRGGKATRPATVPRFEDLPDLCTPAEARAFLRVSRNGIYSLIATKAIPSLKFGNLIRIPKVALLGGEAVNR